MKAVVAILAVAAALAGCAGAGTKPAAPAVPEYPVTLDVPGGYLSEEVRPLPVGGAVLNMWISRSNVVDEWAAMQAVCLKSGTGEKVCLNRVAMFRGDVTMVATNLREFGPEPKGEALNQSNVAQGFKNLDKARVAVSASGSSVTYRIDDQEPIVYPVGFPVESLVLFCSSAVCHFEQGE